MGLHTAAYGGRSMCARLHLVINAQRRVLRRWQCARAEDEVIIVAMLRGGGVVCIPDSFPHVWCVCHLHFLSYFCLSHSWLCFPVLCPPAKRHKVFSLSGHTGGKISRFSVSFHFQVQCIGSGINNQVQPWIRLNSGICRKIYLAVFSCAPFLDAAAYCLFCHNSLFFFVVVF